MRLLAISDLHLGNVANRGALLALPDSPDNWLIVAGDVAEDMNQLNMAPGELARRFRKVVWMPGNHELWSIPSGTKDGPLRGEERYLAMVDLMAPRLEEISLGNTYQWNYQLGIGHYLREIFPGPNKPTAGGAAASNLGAVLG